MLYEAAAYEKTFPDLATVIVGSGPPDAVTLYEGLAVKLGLQRTFFVGAKGQDVLAELFSMSEVGMFPSYKEPFGMVFIECMACGTPTIGANSGGPTEFVREEQGVLVPEEEDWRSEAGAKRLDEKIAGAVTKALNEDWKGKTKGPACVLLVGKGAQTRVRILSQKRSKEQACPSNVVEVITLSACCLLPPIAVSEGTLLLHTAELARSSEARAERMPACALAHGRARGSFPIRRQRGHPGVALPLVVSNPANH